MICTLFMMFSVLTTTRFGGVNAQCSDTCLDDILLEIDELQENQNQMKTTLATIMNILQAPEPQICELIVNGATSDHYDISGFYEETGKYSEGREVYYNQYEGLYLYYLDISAGNGWVTHDEAGEESAGWHSWTVSTENSPADGKIDGTWSILTLSGNSYVERTVNITCSGTIAPTMPPTEAPTDVPTEAPTELPLHIISFETEFYGGLTTTSSNFRRQATTYTLADASSGLYSGGDWLLHTGIFNGDWQSYPNDQDNYKTGTYQSITYTLDPGDISFLAYGRGYVSLHLSDSTELARVDILNDTAEMQQSVIAWDTISAYSGQLVYLEIGDTNTGNFIAVDEISYYGYLEPACGDGIVQPSLGETCDDQNGDDSDGCFGNQCVACSAGEDCCLDANGDNNYCLTYFSEDQPCPVKDQCGVQDCTQQCFNCDQTCPYCFSASSTTQVLLSNGQTKEVRIDELQIGDRVQSVDDSGSVVYSEMYFEPHMFPSTGAGTIAPMLKFRYDGGYLDISPVHLLYVSGEGLPAAVDHCIIHESQKVCLYLAKQAKVGHTVWVTEPALSGKMELVPKMIQDISWMSEEYRAPQTLNGNIVINGVLCSVYVHSHDSNQAMNSWLRTLYQFYSPAFESEFFLDMWMNKLRFLRVIPAELSRRFDTFAEYGSFLVYGFYSLVAYMGFFVVQRSVLKSSTLEYLS